MKKVVLLGVSIFLACNPSQKTVSEAIGSPPKKVDPTVYANSITEEELKEHLYIYASDEFEGRETGTPGQKKAVEYLKSEYLKIGLPAAKSNGNYFQKVPLEIGNIPTGSISINGETHQLGEDVLTFSTAEDSIYEITYVGYGIDDTGYSDYENIDVSEKVVLFKSGEPKDSNGNYLLSENTKKSAWSNASEALGKKSNVAFGKGARGVIFYDPQNYSRFKSYFLFSKQSTNSSMSIGSEVSDKYILLMNENVMKQLKSDIDTDHKARSFKANLILNVKSNNKKIDTENVAAIIKGAEKPNEYVIISSHLDHIGTTEDGQINNGADDDGSGSVAMLEIAEAFQKAAKEGHGPKRSIVFLHVTGEEKGLLGSRYYTDYDPIFPLKNTVANLNIDMIGRVDPKREGDRNYVYLIGSDKLSTELHNLSEEINSKYTNLVLDYKYNNENDPNRFYYRSDHYNFAKNNIPIIFYFNGTHDDYHRPGDTPDKIEYDLLKNRTQLVFFTAWELANRSEKVIVDKPAK